jgi:DNA polymerase
MLEELQKLCLNCNLCPLGQNEITAKGQTFDPHVFSNMKNNKNVIIAQNPGFNECILRKPLVGQSGKNLINELNKHNLSRKNFYITNAVHCYTPKNRTPTMEEQEACWPLVQMELIHLQPDILITLGKFPFSIFSPGIAYSDGLGSIIPIKIQDKDVRLFPVYHPSGQNLAIKRRKRKFERDIAILAKLIHNED